MFIKYKTFVALSFAAMAALLCVVTGCMKMDTTTTEPVLNIAEGSFDTPPQYSDGFKHSKLDFRG